VIGTDFSGSCQSPQYTPNVPTLNKTFWLWSPILADILLRLFWFYSSQTLFKFACNHMLKYIILPL